HAADVFLQVGIDASDRHANTAVGIAHPPPENHGSDEDEGQHGEGDQRQLPVHSHHDGHNAGQHEHVLENGHHPGGEHFVERIHVGGDASDQAAHRIPVEKADMHALQVAEDLAAQVKHHRLPGPLHVVGLYVLQEKADHQGAYV